MPRAKKYPGVPVINKRFGGRRMYMIDQYRSHRKLVGIYSDAFDAFVGLMARRIRAHQQNVIMIEGNTGAGKSTLAILFCIALAKKLKVPFDLKKDYIYSTPDLWTKISTKDASPINLIDEAVLVVNSKRAMSRESVDTVNLFNTMRSLGWTTFLVGPSVYQIDKTVRVVHIDYLIHCSSEDDCPLKGYGRGFFEEYKAKRSRFSKDAEPYWALQLTGVYGKLPPAVDAEYQPIKLAAQQRLIERMKERYGIEAEGEDPAGQAEA